MKPDNYISRIVRPGVLIWLTVLFTVLMLVDGNVKIFTVKEIYINVLETIMVTAYASYFLGKSGEHISRINGREYRDRDRNQFQGIEEYR